LISKTEELLASSVGTLHHIPSSCRKPMAEALGSALRRLHEKNDVQSAWLVATLPRLILFPLARGGRRHNRQVTGILMERLRRWAAGDFESLFREVLSTQKPIRGKPREQQPGDPDVPTSIQRAVKAAVNEGALHKATVLLLESSAPLSNPVDALQKLHPIRSVPVTPIASSVDSLLELDAPAIIKACKSFPPGSTGGPSGLRPCHLQEMLESDDDFDLAEALAAFSSDLVNGLLPSESRNWFCGARVIGIPKKPSGVRPIAVGEVLRRLAAKCLVHHYQAEVVQRLLPCQVGVGVPNAAELVAHAVRAWAELAKEDESLILVDFENAYNSLDRQKMLQAISEESPLFLPYANFCYGAPTPLVGRDFQLLSCEGTQQGDVCGPLFFAVTLKQLIQSACSDQASAWNRWYLDDGALCGKTVVVEQMFHNILQKAPDYGLKVNLSKCKQWCPVKELCETLVPAVSAKAGIKVLGIPIGSRSFIKEETSKVLEKLQLCLQRLDSLGCAFSAFHILRSCLSGCRVTHLLRTIPFDQAEQLAKDTHAKMLESFGRILGTPSSVQQWSLASLPVRMGGLGLLDPTSIVAPAHVAAFISSSVAVLENGLLQRPVSHEFLRALTQLSASSPALCSSLRNAVTLGISCGSELKEHKSFEQWFDQHSWTGHVHNFSAQILSETLPPRMRKMRELSSGAHAGLWLLSPQTKNPHVKWASADFQALLCWRLGVPLGLPLKCSACGLSQDPMGDHALCCTSLGIYTRHNCLRDTLATELCSLGFPCRTEVCLPGTSQVPADIFLPHIGEDSPTAVDVSVVHPLQPSASKATVTTGTAAEARAESKVRTYGEQCRVRSWAFVAFVAETTGAWNQAAQRFVRKVARAHALRTGVDQKSISSALWMKLSRSVARAVGRQLVRARSGLTQGELPPAPFEDRL
jgi:hypothetical protein